MPPAASHSLAAIIVSAVEKAVRDFGPIDDDDDKKAARLQACIKAILQAVSPSPMRIGTMYKILVSLGLVSPGERIENSNALVILNPERN